MLHSTWVAIGVCVLVGLGLTGRLDWDAQQQELDRYCEGVFAGDIPDYRGIWRAECLQHLGIDPNEPDPVFRAPQGDELTTLPATRLHGRMPSLRRWAFDASPLARVNAGKARGY